MAVVPISSVLQMRKLREDECLPEGFVLVGGVEPKSRSL